MKKLVIGLVILIIGLVFFYKFELRAESVPTNITVGNSPPSITSGPTADPTNNSWVNEGEDITFTVTANEPNGESYYLAVCDTGGITPGSGGSAPTCDSFTICISSLTSSDSQASCFDTVDDSYGFNSSYAVYVCDNNSSASECTYGTSGGYKVNHDPSFTAISDDGGSGTDSGADPAGTITFTAIASDSDDNPQPDTDPDAVKLIVCADTNGAYANGCQGTLLCSSSYVSSNPTCNYSVPSVALDGDINYYAYVFDEYGSLGSSSNYRSGTYLVNNVAPTVSSVLLNGGNDIDLTENTWVNIYVTGTVTDNNSCQDLSSVTASAYRSNIGYNLCDIYGERDDDSCYSVYSCTVDGGTCTDSSDPSADYSCLVYIMFHADPTVANTQYSANNWLATISADDESVNGYAETASGVEMNALNAIDVDNTIDYGNTLVGDKDSTLDNSIDINNTGNIGLDLEFSGTNMTDGGSGTIPVGNQRYGLHCIGQDYDTEGIILTTTPTEREFDMAKPTDINTYLNWNVLWGIEIPTNIPPGSYSGTNTIVSVWGETAGWDYTDPCGGDAQPF